MKVRALIVDDERAARAGLMNMLNEVAWLTCVGEAADGPAAVEAINDLKPDLVFLDIQMPGLSGIEALKLATHRPVVIFTTAYAQHAVTAFELGALDYLLKPFGAERLGAALARVRAALGEPAEVPALDRLAEALGQGPISRLFVRAGASVIPIAVSEVRWFEARGDYVAAHTTQAKHLLHLSLNRLEERLDPARFLRIHRTHIVNLDFVKGFRRDEKGRMVAELVDATLLAVSRAKATEVRALGK